MRTVHFLNFALYGALIVGSMLAWPALPGRVPRNFDANGNVTRWAEPSLITWFTPVLVALGCCGLLYGVRYMLFRWPQLLNFPRKHDFLRLPPDRRAPVVAVFARMAALSAVPLGVLFCGLQFWSWRAAVGTQPPATGPGFLLVVLALGVLPAAIALGSIGQANRALDEALRER